jgi:hypothetical protein
MKIKRRFVGAVIMIGVVFGLTGASEAREIRLKVSAKVDCVDVPVHTVIDLPEPFANLPADEIAVIIRQISRGMARIYGMPIPG